MFCFPTNVGSAANKSQPSFDARMMSQMRSSRAQIFIGDRGAGAAADGADEELSL